MMNEATPFAHVLIALLIATAVWLPFLQFIFRPTPNSFFTDKTLSPRARAMVARHLRLWEDPKLRQKELAKMRGTNAEWDFMDVLQCLRPRCRGRSRPPRQN